VLLFQVSKLLNDAPAYEILSLLHRKQVPADRELKVISEQLSPPRKSILRYTMLRLVIIFRLGTDLISPLISLLCLGGATSSKKPKALLFQIGPG